MALYLVGNKSWAALNIELSPTIWCSCFTNGTTNKIKYFNDMDVLKDTLLVIQESLRMLHAKIDKLELKQNYVVALNEIPQSNTYT